MSSIETAIAEAVRIDISSISDDLDMTSVSTWDSLAHMELIANLETMFCIEFSAEEIVSMTSVVRIRKLVAAKRDT